MGEVSGVKDDGEGEAGALVNSVIVVTKAISSPVPAEPPSGPGT